MLFRTAEVNLMPRGKREHQGGIWMKIKQTYDSIFFSCGHQTMLVKKWGSGILPGVSLLPLLISSVPWDCLISFKGFPVKFDLLVIDSMFCLWFKLSFIKLVTMLTWVHREHRIAQHARWNVCFSFWEEHTSWQRAHKKHLKNLGV